MTQATPEFGRPVPDTPPSASVNRIRIVDLPGLLLDETVRGQPAYHLLSAPTVAAYALQHAAALGIPNRYRDAPPDAPEVRRQVPLYVDQSLQSTDPAARGAAEAIARRLGRNLGAILLTLHRGDAVNRAARPDWPDTAWAQWATIRHVWVGGGVMRGALGDAIVAHAQALLIEAGVADRLEVAKEAHPSDMALTGVAAYLPIEAQTGGDYALCLDFGQTSVKRALVRTRPGPGPARLTLSTLPVPWAWRNSPEAGHGIDGEQVLRFMAEAICGACEEATAQGRAIADGAALSVAAYVHDGVLFGNGLYARINPAHAIQPDTVAAQKRTLDARRLVSDAVARLCGRHFGIEVVHDGTAAAAHHAGEPETVVIVVGTALGVGFPPR